MVGLLTEKNQGNSQGTVNILSPRHLPNTGIEPESPALQVDSFTTEPPGKSILDVKGILKIHFILPKSTV